MKKINKKKYLYLINAIIMFFFSFYIILRFFLKIGYSFSIVYGVIGLILSILSFYKYYKK
jgi:hypothetical protein